MSTAPASLRPRRPFYGAVVAHAIVLVLGAPAAARAQETRDPHDVQPERPTVATHAGTVAPGWFELETGVERDRGEVPGLYTLLTPTTLKFGVASHAQLSIWGNTVHAGGGGTSASGLGDVSVGVKWRLVDDAPVVGDFAVLPSVKLATGSQAKRFGTGTTDATLLLISSHDFNGVSLDINTGLTRRSGDGTNAPKTATFWTVSVGAPIVGGFGWTAETYGYPGTGGPAGDAPIVALLTGPTFQYKWIAFDAGIITPFTGPQPHALYAGLVWNVGCMLPPGHCRP